MWTRHYVVSRRLLATLIMRGRYATADTIKDNNTRRVTFAANQRRQDLDLGDLCGSVVLAIGAAHLLGACGFLARLVLNGTDNLLDSANDLVLDGWLSLVMSSWGALLGNTDRFGLLGANSARLARRLSGNGWEDAWLGIAGCASCLGHCDLELGDGFWG
jgi:hypothetical protein